MPRLLVPAFAVLMGLALAFVSLVPALAPGHADKLLHFSAHALWVSLVFLALPKGARRWPYALAMLAFGIVIEAIQPFTGRSFSYADMAANGAGILAGALASVPLCALLIEPGRRRLAAFTLAGLVAGLYPVVSGTVMYGPGLAFWNCDYVFTVGDNARGDRPWRGELVCARLMAGGRDLSPSGAPHPNCGAPRPKAATALLELGSQSAHGSPRREAPLPKTVSRPFCQEVRAAHSFVLEAWVRSDTLDQKGPARIINFADTTRRTNLSLGQLYDVAQMRLRTPQTGHYAVNAFVQTAPGSFTTDPLKITYHYAGGMAALSTSAGGQDGPKDIDPLVPGRIKRELSVGLIAVGLILAALAGLQGLGVIVSVMRAGLGGMARQLRPQRGEG